jgi:hypothetical protein
LVDVLGAFVKVFRGKSKEYINKVGVLLGKYFPAKAQRARRRDKAGVADEKHVLHGPSGGSTRIVMGWRKKKQGKGLSHTEPLSSQRFGKYFAYREVA